MTEINQPENLPNLDFLTFPCSILPHAHPFLPSILTTALLACWPLHGRTADLLRAVHVQASCLQPVTAWNRQTRAAEQLECCACRACQRGVGGGPPAAVELAERRSSASTWLLFWSRKWPSEASNHHFSLVKAAPWARGNLPGGRRAQNADFLGKNG